MANKRETFFNYPNASQNVAVQRQLYFITKNDTLSIVQVASDATSLTAQQLNVLKDRAIMIQYDGLIYTFVGATDDTLTYRHIVSDQVLKDMTITLPSGAFTVTDVTILHDTPIVNVTFTAEEGVELSEADMTLIQNDPATILCADISALNHGYKKLYMTRGATPQEGYSFIFSDFGDTYLVDVAYGSAVYTYFKWETSYLYRHDVTENSIYVERADGTLITIPLTVDVKPNTAVVRNDFGGIEVNDVPSNDNEAINKKYADGRFVKNQSQYANKPAAGVYAFSTDGDVTKDEVRRLTHIPVAWTVPQFDGNGKLHSETVSAADADDTVANKAYVDGRFVGKQTATDDVYYAYGYHKSEQISYGTSVGIKPYYLVSRDANGDVLVPDTPIANDAATSKSYVDTLGASKLDKKTGVDGNYYMYGFYNSTQGTYLTSSAVTPNAIPFRTNNGDVLVPDTPSTDGAAASKKYVDNSAFPSSGGTIQGDVVITGNLTVTGENKSADVENLRVKDLLIEVGKDNPGFTFPAGLKYRYSVDGKYSALVWDKNGIAHVGDVVLDANGNVNLAESTQLQALATRPESGTDGGIMVWDNENKTMMIDGQTVANFQSDLAILQEGKLDKKTATDDVYHAYGYHNSDQISLATSTGINPLYLVSRDSNGDVLVPDAPTANNAATSKNYVNNGFVKNKSQYTNKPDYGVYTFGLTDDTLTTLASGPQAFCVTQYDSAAKLHSSTVVADDSDDTVANKGYVDNGFVKKRTPEEEDVSTFVYGGSIQGGTWHDVYYELRTRPKPYVVPLYDGDGDLTARLEPTYEGSATSKKYVDTHFVKKVTPEENIDVAYVSVMSDGVRKDAWYQVITSPRPWAIPQYTGDGDLRVPTVPAVSQGATSKSYVDNLVLQGGTGKAVKIGTYADNGLSVSASKIGNVVTMFLTAIGNIATGTYTITVPDSCHSASIGYDFTVNNTTTAAQIPSGVLGWTGESDIAEGSVISLTWNHSTETFTFSATATISQMQYAIQYVAADMTALNPSTSGKALATVESISGNVINISTDYQDAGSIFDCNSFEVEIYNPLTNNVDLSACSISDGIKSVSAQSMLSNSLAGGIMTCKDDVIVLTGRKIGETLRTTCGVKRAREYLAIPVYQYCAGYQGDLIIHFGSGAMLNTDTFSIDTLVDATGTLILPTGTYSTAAQLPVVLSAEIVWDGNRRPVNVVAVSASRVNFFVDNLKISGSSNVSNYQQLYFGRTGNVNIAEHDPTPRIVFGG